MKKLFSSILLFSIVNFSMGQMDAGVTGITAPVSGCSLTSTQSVTVKIFNYGSNIVLPFNVSYRINLGVPVTEVINTPILSNSTFTYTFTTPANLSVAGSYTFDAFTNLGGDVNATNDSLKNYIVINSAPSVGGTVNPSGFTVCSGSNFGAVSVTGETGSVVNWESSIDGGNTWTVLSNTSTTQNFNNLTVTTTYRAVIKNGSCPATNSLPATIIVAPQAVGGTLSSNATVCSGTNNGTLNLTGHTGNVAYWEFSINSGGTWTVIGNTTTSQTYTNLTQTTWYHAVVQSGFCSSSISTDAIITVDPVSVGGSVTGGATVCSGSNSGSMTLSGHTGNIVQWEYSTDGGSTWLPISNTSTIQNYNNVNVTTAFRALVQSGICPAAASSQTILTVTPPSVGGAVSGNATVCNGANSGALNLGGETGSVQNWEFSVNFGGSWTGIVNTTTTEAYTNLTQTTWYRAIVQNGSCPSSTSSIGVITVDSMTVGGTASSSATVCSGSNGATLNVTGFTGNVLRWEYSVDGGSTWTPINTTSSSISYSNIIVSTMYRAIVQKGVCPALPSTAAVITVDPASDGGIVSSSATVCSGNNNATLVLSGHVGNVTGWLSSVNSGGTWTPIVNTTTSQNYTNLVANTWYRALVKSGVCTADSSAIAMITISPPTVAGNILSAATVCSGTNSGNLTLVGQTGNVLRWETSTDGGSTWNNLSNTTMTQTYTNLTVTTAYRAVVQSGVCASANTPSTIITVDPKSIGGIVSSSATVCSGTNSGTLVLSGKTGNVVSWLSSINSGATWNVIINSSNSQVYTNLTQTTWYRALVQSGVCTSDSSSIAIITVDPVSVGGSVNSNTIVCSGNNSGTLNLTGQTGTIIGWEWSNDGGSTWLTISNTTASQTFTNLTTTTMYRALVRSGVCASANSAAATITVMPKSVGGTVSTSTSVCSQYNSGTVSVSGHTGSVTGWQFSINSGGSWTDIVNTTTSQSYTNLNVTTWYRAIVQSGLCAVDTSASAVITVNPKPIVAFTATTVCHGQPTIFANTSSVGSGFIQSFQWDYADNTTGSGLNPSHTYGSASTYSVSLIATTDKGCLDTAIVTATVNALPSNSIAASGALQFCNGDSITLSAVTGFKYLWSTADTNQTITIKTSGKYVLTITNTTTGCSNSDSVNVTVYTLPSVSAGLDTTISLGESTQLIGSSITALTYSWLPFGSLSNASILNPVASPTSTTTYTLTVSDVNGCMSSDSVKVKVNTDYKLVVSNLLTPNSDGKNDTWFIENIQSYSDNTVLVYNRFGMQVFKQEGYSNAWDGGTLPDGTYYYVITFSGNTEEVLKGAVTILRK